MPKKSNNKNVLITVGFTTLLLCSLTVFLMIAPKENQNAVNPAESTPSSDINVPSIVDSINPDIFPSLPVTTKPSVPPKTTKEPEKSTYDPIIKPEIDISDVKVPLNEPVERPTEDVDVQNNTSDEVTVKTSSTPKPTPKPTAKPTPKPTAKPAVEPTVKPAKSEPKSGDTNSKGQTYVPGFGWVSPGAPNQGKTTDSDGDINKMVGEMG